MPNQGAGGQRLGARAGKGGGLQEVVVKGWRNGLLLVIPPDGTWDEVMAQVDAKLDEAKARSFWRGAQTTFDLGLREATSSELDALFDRCKRAFGLVPIALVAAGEATRTAAEKLALVSYAEMPVVKKPAPREEKQAAAASPASPVSNALYVPATVRSGQRIVHEGHLIVCGDVNAGAEVVAGGDVLIFGTLRGLAHAGAWGDESARIIASSLRPPQLRIAGRIARSPEEAIKGPQAGRAPEVARIENGEIQVSPF